jgi:hypothetical protein
LQIRDAGYQKNMKWVWPCRTILPKTDVALKIPNEEVCFIKKPFSRKEQADKVREALGQK